MADTQKSEALILIPAYKPNQRLVALIDDLHARKQENIVVVNDGSGKEYDFIFEQLSEKCTIIQHAVNCGKGRALKTGFNYFLLNYPNAAGIVTADADGQHRADDIIKISDKLKSNPEKIILGVRKFDNAVPWRSKFGNIVTKYVFYFILGLKISDTQTGLRGIPAQLIPEFLTISYDRYEYETSMLISAKQLNTGIIEERIETVYIDKNRSSHFNPIFDSLRIYFLIIRFAISSVLASILDTVVFLLCYWLGAGILFSTIGSRSVSGTFNYIFNERVVFKSPGNYVHFIKYWLLVITLGSLAYFMIKGIHNATDINILIIKVFIEMLLFVISFTAQRFLIFTDPCTENDEKDN